MNVLEHRPEMGWLRYERAVDEMACRIKNKNGIALQMVRCRFILACW